MELEVHLLPLFIDLKRMNILHNGENIEPNKWVEHEDQSLPAYSKDINIPAERANLKAVLCDEMRQVTKILKARQKSVRDQ